MWSSWRGRTLGSPEDALSRAETLQQRATETQTHALQAIKDAQAKVDALNSDVEKKTARGKDTTAEAQEVVALNGRLEKLRADANGEEDPHEVMFLELSICVSCLLLVLVAAYICNDRKRAAAREASKGPLSRSLIERRRG